MTAVNSSASRANCALSAEPPRPRTLFRAFRRQGKELHGAHMRSPDLVHADCVPPADHRTDILAAPSSASELGLPAVASTLGNRACEPMDLSGEPQSRSHRCSRAGVFPSYTSRAGGCCPLPFSCSRPHVMPLYILHPSAHDGRLPHQAGHQRDYRAVVQPGPRRSC